MKIVFLVSSLNAGGAERVACTLVNAWVEKGHQVTLIPCFTQGSGQSFYPLDERVKVRWLSEYLPQNKWFSRLSKPRILRALMREEKADVMVSFLTNVNVVSLLAARGLGIPLIVGERTDPANQRISSSLKFLRKVLYSQASAVLVQTQRATEYFKSWSLRKLRVIPNPLPANLIFQAPNALAPSVVLAMGRLVPTKQFDRLIENFSQIAAAYPDWQLHIYGDGPEREKLQQLIVEKGLASRMLLKGKTDKPWEVMRQARVFAMSSRLEGFPNVMLEAMASGLPVVCYDCPSGPSELSLDGKVAKLVPLDHEQFFQQQLRSLMQNELERAQLAQQGQESVFERYSQPQVLQQWDELLKEVQ